MKTIFLVNPISGRGHLDAYARLYSRAFVELGYRVVLLAETDGETTDYLTRNNPVAAASFSFISFDQTASIVSSSSALPIDESSFISFDRAASIISSTPALTIDALPSVSWRCQMNVLQRAQLVWQEEGAFGTLARCIRVPLRTLAPHSSWLRHQIGRVKRAIARRLLRTRLARALGMPSSVDVGRIMFHPLLDHVGRIASMRGHATPDLVIFLYLDLMAEQKRNTEVLDRPGAFPWVGILFHPRLAQDRNAQVEGYFESGNARGGVFLVPSGIPAYAETTPHLHFALAPDVADLELPAETSDLARDMRERAGNRTIVLLIGSITAHKGIPTLLDVIAAADPSRFFFALIGEVHWESFGEHKSLIKSFYARPPENVYLSQGYISSERDYNGIIAASDIMYAVYEGFDSSSNSLTKAAGFRRPIVVSEHSLMGKRVSKFNIGSVVPAGSVAAISKKLDWLARQPRDDFGFEAYNEEQSLKALKGVLASALTSWLADPSARQSRKTAR
jgi:hypothetical protein